VKDDSEHGDRLLLANRKARHEYEVIDKVEAGLVLLGTEIKSIRDHRVNMGDAYATIENDEAWLLQLHISPYPQAHQFNHDPLRKRKLLLHKNEIRRLRTKVLEKGLTIIPLDLHMKDNRVKVLLGVCRGKKLHDKRATAAERTASREIDRARRGRYE